MRPKPIARPPGATKTESAPDAGNFAESLDSAIVANELKRRPRHRMPLTVLGALLAARPHDTLLDWRLAVVTLANILAVAYAFMINDIEDAPDDARDPDRAARAGAVEGAFAWRPPMRHIARP